MEKPRGSRRRTPVANMTVPTISRTAPTIHTGKVAPTNPPAKAVKKNQAKKDLHSTKGNDSNTKKTPTVVID